MPPSSRMACGIAVSAVSRPSSDARSALTAGTHRRVGVLLLRRSASRFVSRATGVAAASPGAGTGSRRRRSIRARRTPCCSAVAARPTIAHSLRPSPRHDQHSPPGAHGAYVDATRFRLQTQSPRCGEPRRHRRARRWPSCSRRWAFVLLIVCTNVASPQLARGSACEMAVRSSPRRFRASGLSGSSSRASLFALVGGVLGLLIALAAVPLGRSRRLKAGRDAHRRARCCCSLALCGLTAVACRSPRCMPAR